MGGGRWSGLKRVARRRPSLVSDSLVATDCRPSEGPVSPRAFAARARVTAGLRCPTLVVADGAPGIWKAAFEAWPIASGQRSLL
jgi:hypothetical protein